MKKIKYLLIVLLIANSYYSKGQSNLEKENFKKAVDYIFEGEHQNAESLKTLINWNGTDFKITDSFIQKLLKKLKHDGCNIDCLRNSELIALYPKYVEDSNLKSQYYLLVEAKKYNKIYELKASYDIGRGKWSLGDNVEGIYDSSELEDIRNSIIDKMYLRKRYIQTEADRKKELFFLEYFKETSVTVGKTRNVTEDELGIIKEISKKEFYKKKYIESIEVFDSKYNIDTGRFHWSVIVIKEIKTRVAQSAYRYSYNVSTVSLDDKPIFEKTRSTFID